MKFTLYFVGYGKEDEVPTDSHERTQWTFHQRGVLELTQYVAWISIIPHIALLQPMQVLQSLIHIILDLLNI